MLVSKKPCGLKATPCELVEYGTVGYARLSSLAVTKSGDREGVQNTSK